MRAHFFLGTSSTCATYLWPNMAAPAPVITCAFQLVGQKIILPFGTNISLLLKFHWLKNLPCSWQTWGWWAHRSTGEYDPTSEHLWWVTGATTLHSYPCIQSSLFLPTHSSSLATSCEELTHWKRLWCWEGLRAGGEGNDRGWDGWMASLTWGMRVCVNPGIWWGIGRPGVL